MSTVDFRISVALARISVPPVSSNYLGSFFAYFGERRSTPHSSVYCHRTPNMSSPCFRSTGRIYTCHQTAGPCGRWGRAIIFLFDSTIGFRLFFPQSPGWRTRSPRTSNWLLWDLLRGNMLPGGQQHTLFKELCLSLFWVSSPQLSLLASFHGNEKIYSGLK